VAPGDRLAVSPIDADPPSGFYRLSVVGSLSDGGPAEEEGPEEGTAVVAAAEAEAEVSGSGGEAEADMEAVWAMVDARQRQAGDGEEEAGEEGDGGDEGGGGRRGATAAAPPAAAAAALLVAVDTAAALAQAVLDAASHA
jgi:hypothetical protein